MRFAFTLLIALSLFPIHAIAAVGGASGLGSQQTVRKALPARKTEHPPTIDGALNNTCWQDAPQGVGFTDERTEKLAKSQSAVWFVYTDTAVYVALHLATPAHRHGEPGF